MRLIALAAALFAVGFGIVSIGQDAFGFYRADRIRERPQGSSSVQTASLGRTAPRTFADYLAAAESAFAKMDRTCSAANRKTFGRAFHQLLAATRALRAGRIEAGDLGSMAVRQIADARPDTLLVDAALSGDMPVFAQVFDATRRGVLTAADLPPGMTVLMDAQLKLARGGDNRNVGPLVQITANRPTRCAPM